MDDFDIQKTETVSSCFKYDDISMLILEELRTFRREMKDEVRKLQENVQNFLFSKADIINALLENSYIFNKVDEITENSSTDKFKDSCAELKSQLNKVNNEKRRKIIKLQPTTVEVIKPVHVSNTNSVIATSVFTKPLANSDVKPLYMSSSDASVQCVNPKMASIMNEFIADDNKDDTVQHQLKVQVLQCNGNLIDDPSKGYSSIDKNSKDHTERHSKNFGQSAKINSELQRVNPEKIIPLNKINLYPKSKSGLSLLSSTKNALVVPVHSAPKLPTKFNNYIGKMKNLPGFDKSPYSSEQKYTSRVKRPCHFCGRVYASSSDLKRHIRIHTGDRPFQCELCPKAYTRNDHLQRHIRQKHFCKAVSSKGMPYESMDNSTT